MNRKRNLVLLSFLISIELLSCSSTKEVFAPSAEGFFRRGMELYSDGDYVKAKDDFDIVIKQFPASEYADSAQFFLAQTYFKRGEYLTAAFEFENVSRNYPTSKLLPEARYNIALCYAARSPRPQLDQENTKKAIEAFQMFIDYYPTSKLVGDAEKQIQALRNKLAKKNLEIAQLYYTMGYYRAAIIYFDVILNEYHDSDVADQAALGKVRALLERHRRDDARVALEKFYSMFPNSKLRSEADKLAEGLELTMK